MPKSAAEDTGITTEGATATRKRAVNRGARGPQPIYIFVKSNATSGKLEVTKSFRNPAKMAAYFGTAQEEGSQFLVTTPE